MPEDENLARKTILENGVRVITETMPGVRSIAIACLFDTGPYDETPAQYGLSHLVEHGMFLGTTGRNAMQIARMMDGAGGSIGAFTAKDYMCYYATVLDDYAPYALDLLGDLLLNSTYPEDGLEREKNAILREIAGRNDDPEQRANELLKSFAWTGHPLGRSIPGSAETAQRFTREDVIYFVHSNYLPDRLIVAAAGNVNHDDFVAQVRDAFWRMLGNSQPRSSAPPAYQSGIVMAVAPVSQAYFALGLRALPYTHPDRYGLHVLNSVLGGGISSRLYRRLRENRGLVYSISSEYLAYREDGMLIVEGSTAPEYLNTVLGLTLVELWQLVSGSEPSDDEELAKAKMHIRAQHLISGENSHTRMSRLATQELYFGHSISTDQVLAQIGATDNAVLQHLADETLADALRHVTIAVVGPQAPDHYNRDSLEKLLKDFE
ncbi:mitochondrial-processing peptidase subunit alpha [Anaerolineae bacterium]|nr:mitochondrial-processing peptidase subunit alpha [Anaerolineae bacterium]